MKRADPAPAAVISSTTARPRSAFRPCTITCAPCAASAIASSRPSPSVDPVTSAVLPAYGSAGAASRDWQAAGSTHRPASREHSMVRKRMGTILEQRARRLAQTGGGDGVRRTGAICWRAPIAETRPAAGGLTVTCRRPHGSGAHTPQRRSVRASVRSGGRRRASTPRSHSPSRPCPCLPVRCSCR